MHSDNTKGTPERHSIPFSPNRSISEKDVISGLSADPSSPAANMTFLEDFMNLRVRFLFYLLFLPFLSEIKSFPVPLGSFLVFLFGSLVKRNRKSHITSPFSNRNVVINSFVRRLNLHTNLLVRH